jgi:hypothetical protein
LTWSMIHATPHCRSDPIGSETNASASKPAETAPNVPPIQLG